jgi:hypothetical protein
VICPSCRTAAERLPTLNALAGHGECHLCDLSFGLDLDESVEATFLPTAMVRRVDPGRYCMGGPALTPHVLAQFMGKGAEHAYKITLVKEIVTADLNLEVSFLPISGKADMGGGLIWRAADDRNYYLARANPLEQNIRVYRVEKGIRHLLENFNQTIDVKRWHTLRVTHQGCRVNIFYDDKQVFDLCDKTFHAGMIGLWTKSDAVTYFDDLRLQYLK